MRRHAREQEDDHGALRTQQQRRRIAVEAARLMSEEGIRDFHLAKRKAAAHLGIFAETYLPKNSEIDAALREHQRLFQADTQPQFLQQRREVALDAMRFFAAFEPRLVGAVLDGSADEHSAVCLHLFSDDPRMLQNLLDENHIPYDEESRFLRLTREDSDEFPVYLFSADDIAIDLTLLPLDLLRQAPLSRIDGKPMKRASRGALELLLSEKSD
jgi:hypothetical protein